MMATCSVGKFRKAAIVVVMLVLAMGALAVATQDEALANRRMIFVTHDMHPFFIPTIVGMQDACGMVGWECQFVGPPSFSVEGTADRLWSAVEARVDAIATVLSDPTAYNDAVQRALDLGIAVIAYDTDNEWRQQTQAFPYVGGDDIPSGRINGIQAARHAKEVTGRDEGKILIVTCCPGHTALEARIQGTIQGIQEVSNYEVEVFNGGDDATQYVARLEAKWAAEGDRIVAIAGVDAYTENIGRFIEFNNLKGKVAGGGFDLLDTILEGIRDGYLQWAIGQDPYSQGFIPVMLAWLQLERGYPPRSYDTGAEVVDASNVERVIARESLWKEKGKELGF